MAIDNDFSIENMNTNKDQFANEYERIYSL